MLIKITRYILSKTMIHTIMCCDVLCLPGSGSIAFAYFQEIVLDCHIWLSIYKLLYYYINFCLVIVVTKNSNIYLTRYYTNYLCVCAF